MAPGSRGYKMTRGSNSEVYDADAGSSTALVHTAHPLRMLVVYHYSDGPVAAPYAELAVHARIAVTHG